MDEIKARLIREAHAIHDEDVASCKAMGQFGATVVPANARILTHCNAGALATAGYGTALGVIRAAAEQGKVMQVFADETRPFLQGARLTAWELVRDGVPTTVITESMAGPLMQQGGIDFIVVGADRIAANGDFANKIGTYTVAMMAKAHNVPFYVAAPLSTIDLATADGAAIPIEQRNPKEVTHMGPIRLDAGGRQHLEPRIRRDAPCAGRGHHYGEGHRARALFGQPAATVQPRMNVLGIETSCDETAAAVVSTTGDPAKPWRVRSNIIASQAEIHREWGGVVPEIASRQHVRDICGVVERALGDAGVDWPGVDAIAVTQGPGLIGSLLVGVSFAKATAAALERPVVAVHHLAGHIESIVLEHGAMPMPALILVVSGGHTSLYFVESSGPVPARRPHARRCGRRSV